MDQSRPGSDSNEGVLQNPQSPALWEPHHQVELVSSSEMQLVYSTALIDWTLIFVSSNSAMIFRKQPKTFVEPKVKV